MHILTVDKLNLWKDVMISLSNVFQTGILFLETDHKKIVWRMASASFDIPQLNLGAKISPEEAAAECMQTCRSVAREITGQVYGTRLKMYAMPIWDSDQVVGSLVAAVPLVHPVSSAFEYFAPVVAGCFPEGVSLLMTDLDKYTRQVDSEIFSFMGFTLGSCFNDSDVAQRAIEKKQLCTEDYPADVYGTPVRIVASPLLDPVDPNRAYGNLVMCIPRSTAADLINVSDFLRQELNEINLMVERLNDLAISLQERELHLNTKVEELGHISEARNEVIGQLINLADGTKMAGLNAAMGALQAGQSGFGTLALEIKKFSDASKGTIKDVTKLTADIRRTLEATKADSCATLESCQEQAEAAAVVRTRLAEIAGIAEKLDHLSKIM